MKQLFTLENVKISGQLLKNVFYFQPLKTDQTEIKLSIKSIIFLKNTMLKSLMSSENTKNSGHICARL